MPEDMITKMMKIMDQHLELIKTLGVALDQLSKNFVDLKCKVENLEEKLNESTLQ